MVVRVKVLMALSKRVLRKRAAKIPRNRANGTAIVAAKPPKKIVLASRMPINSEISRLLARDTPRSPVNIPPSQLRYRKCAGTSSPSSVLKTFTVSGVAP